MELSHSTAARESLSSGYRYRYLRGVEARTTCGRFFRVLTSGVTSMASPVPNEDGDGAPERMMKVRDVARVLNLSRWTVYDKVRDGSLKAKMLFGQLRFYPRDVAALLTAPPTQREVSPAQREHLERARALAAKARKAKCMGKANTRKARGR
jgi:excisionase family DNA binding protein